MPKYDLSSPLAITSAASQAREYAGNQPNQDSYNTAWLHGYAAALTEVSLQLGKEKGKANPEVNRSTVIVGVYADELLPNTDHLDSPDRYFGGRLEVDRAWAERQAKALEYKNLEEFMDEFTWDQTIGWYKQAVLDGALIKAEVVTGSFSSLTSEIIHDAPLHNQTPIDVKVIIDNGVVECTLQNSTYPVNVEIIDIDKDYEDYAELDAYRTKLYKDASYTECEYTTANFEKEPLLDNSHAPDITIPFTLNHIDTWHPIDHRTINGTFYYLMEHDKYNDEVANIIIDAQGKLVLANVYDGFDPDTVNLLKQKQAASLSDKLNAVRDKTSGHTSSPTSKEKPVEHDI